MAFETAFQCLTIIGSSLIVVITAVMIRVPPPPPALPRSRLFWYRSQLSGTGPLGGEGAREILLQSSVAVSRVHNQEFLINQLK